SSGSVARGLLAPRGSPGDALPVHRKKTPARVGRAIGWNRGWLASVRSPHGARAESSGSPTARRRRGDAIREDEMSKLLKGVLAAAAVLSMSTSVQAQTVGMYGEYHESNGIIVNIPQNPPIVTCPDPNLPGNPLDARCHHRVQKFFGNPQQDAYFHPQVGNHGAQNIPTHPDDADSDGLDVGDPFIIPPSAYRQELGRQGGVVLNNVVD